MLYTNFRGVIFLAAKDYKCPGCGREYRTEVSNPICPDCSAKAKSKGQGKVYLEEK
jgi:DNA-directed RNA polymerase subunit RPC12/RpoP